MAGRPPAVLNAAGWVPGVRGQGVAFKDPNSWVDLGPSDDLNFPARSAFALCGWVQPAKPTGTILSLRNRDDDSTDLDIAVSQGKIEVTVRYDRQNTLNVVHVAGGSVNDGNWHHFVLQRKEDGRLELYVDGAVAQDAASEGGALTTNLRALGRERYWTDKFPGFGDAHFEGCMDEVAVFKRALTPEEIRKLAGQP